MRNKALDISKGIAILLVVVGHTIQDSDKNFDQNLWFRVIYSFHMPLFIMLSGASAFYWFEKFNKLESLQPKMKSGLVRIGKSGITLLLPFYSWAMAEYFYNKKSGLLLNYLNDITFRTDLALWFLPTLFCCIVYLLIGLILFEFAILTFPRNASLFKYCSEPNLKLLFIFITWSLLRVRIHNILGTGMANSFHGGLFLFFLVGIWIQINMKWAERKLVMFMAILLFILLSPFWSRLEGFNSIATAPRFLKNYYIGAGYSVIVALSGSIALLISVKRLWERIPQEISTVLITLGSNTLGIYALHGYFISSKIPVITPIAVSLLITLLIDCLPIFRTVLLGKIGLR